MKSQPREYNLRAIFMNQGELKRPVHIGWHFSPKIKEGRFTTYYTPQADFRIEVYSKFLVTENDSSKRRYHKSSHPRTAVISCKAGNETFLINCFLPKVYVVLQRLKNTKR